MKGPFKPQIWTFPFKKRPFCVCEELSKNYIYLQAFSIFCWNKGIHHTGHGTVYVVINDSWIKEYRVLVQGNGATGASLRLFCSCWGLFCPSALRLFGYMSEGKSLSQHSDATNIYPGTTCLGYWSPNIPFLAETVQIPTAWDGVGTGPHSVGSVYSENELHLCLVTGVACWPLNQHLSPWSTEIRLQSGRTSAPTDDLLFYLEQWQPRRSVGTWLLELITHALGEESRNFAPSPSSNLGL